MKKKSGMQRETHHAGNNLLALVYMGLFGLFSGSTMVKAETLNQEWDALDPSLRGSGHCFCECYSDEDEPLCLQIEEPSRESGPVCVHWYDTFEYDSLTCSARNGTACTGYEIKRDHEYRARGSQECEWVPMEDQNV